ncbi:hypothetical protein I3F58_10000 [Streptomyces sp. MUM 203J]|uniref:hypothetical protein n=1 Tax=Streptomyces sp. MUM 203J TaxID=2791990 RepID=UPI001F03BAB7|nr:hypothetical protein [Streptomyces sp. MUM 203J]MCH0539887.1 hypothetical protein [Streptomyces sp. MUM 203J]
MTDPICRTAVRFRPVFTPGSGRRRAGARPTTAAPAAQPQTSHPPYGQVAQFGPGWGWTARPRPPYGLREMFDGDTVALVRPHLVAHERRQERARQRQRCLTLVMAADFGIDLDRRILHGAGVSR